MKKMHCKDLGGPEECNFVLEGNTFEEIGMKSHTHAKEQIAGGDIAHIHAAGRMVDVSEEERTRMMNEWKQKFDETVAE